MRKRRWVWKVFENLKVESLWYGGVGVSKLEDGKKVLIKWALPDSVVDVRIVWKKRDYFTAHIINVHSVDPKWLDGDQKCPHHLSPYASVKEIPEHAHWCWWCKWQAVSYDKQLDLKQSIVKWCFSWIVSTPEMLDIIWSPLIFWYRNKIEFSFGKYLKRKPKLEDWTKSKEFAIAQHWQMWFHKQGEFSKVVDIDQCYLVSEQMHKVFERIKFDLKKSGLPVHDAKTHKWLLRHLMVREWVHTNHILVNLSLASKHFTDHPKDQQIRRNLLKDWKQDVLLHDLITTFILSENNGLADIMRDADTTHEVIWWEGKIYEELHFQKENDEKEIVRFAISPASFFQTNTVWAEILFATASDMLGEVTWNIIDLYCGWGSIWQCLLALWKGVKVKWIEIVQAAIQDAQYNAKINHVEDKTDYYVGKAEKVLKQGVIDDQFFIWWDVIIVDPPREGMHPDVVAFLIDMKKQHWYRLCYISCNPTTMARDISLLIDSWLFSFNVLQSVDMFPHTHHIECIWILS